jgi:hypothetical protein
MKRAERDAGIRITTTAVDMLPGPQFHRKRWTSPNIGSDS